jgi:hypothetical protein
MNSSTSGGIFKAVCLLYYDHTRFTYFFDRTFIETRLMSGWSNP